MITDYPSAVTLQAIHHTDLGIILKHDGYFCFIVSKESGINQLQELKEKNISLTFTHKTNHPSTTTGQLLNKAGISQAEVKQTWKSPELPLRLQMLQYDQIVRILPPRPCRIHRNECPSPVSDQHTGIGN